MTKIIIISAIAIVSAICAKAEDQKILSSPFALTTSESDSWIIKLPPNKMENTTIFDGKNEIVKIEADGTVYADWNRIRAESAKCYSETGSSLGWQACVPLRLMIAVHDGEVKDMP